jgi:DNA-binding response OmpR family regulator
VSRIAVVDDEKNIREVISIALKKEFYEVDEYTDGLEAWESFQKTLPDLIILDILMPRMDGIELCKKIRSRGGSVPIIFLSSRDEEIDKVLGLESGADDYVSKPFSLRELIARVHAGLRRHTPRGETTPKTAGVDTEKTTAGSAGSPSENSGNGNSGGILRCGDLVMDEDRAAVLWKGTALELTVTEFRMLQNLAGQCGCIKTREQLMGAAFPEDHFPNDRAADSHIKRRRKKFLDLDADFAELEAIYGLGYRWREPEVTSNSNDHDGTESV